MVVVAEAAVAAVRLRFFEGAGALAAKKSSSAGRLGAAAAVEVEARGACFCLQGLRLDACGSLPRRERKCVYLEMVHVACESLAVKGRPACEGAECVHWCDSRL